MPPPINQSQETNNQSEDGMSVRDALRTSRGVRTLFDQSEHDYSVRHAAYVMGHVRCFNQSERDYSVRHGAYVRCFNQSEHSYGVRHGVYVTGHTYAVLTNQSIAMAYVTGCTSRGIRTPTINQSERATIAYVTGCTSRGIRTLF